MSVTVPVYINTENLKWRTDLQNKTPKNIGQIFIVMIIILIKDFQATDDVKYMQYNIKKTKPHITHHHNSRSVDLVKDRWRRNPDRSGIINIDPGMVTESRN